MPRAKRGFKARRRRNRVLKWAKGFRGKRKNCHAIANESVQHAWMHMYRSRKQRKRDFRGLWIQRINAAARTLGVSYSFLFMQANGGQLRELASLYDAGHLRPLIDKTFPFDQTLEALAYVEQGRANGKVVITLD